MLKIHCGCETIAKSGEDGEVVRFRRSGEEEETIYFSIVSGMLRIIS